MAFRCPPELLLRNSLRKASQTSLQLSNVSGSRMYRAAAITELGKPLNVTKMPSESVPSGCVKLGIRSCGVNFADILMAKGQYQYKPPLPYIGGSEVAGVVIAVGEDVDEYKVGDRVFGMSVTGGGGYAEELVLPTMSVSLLPDNVSFHTGASVLVSYCTAYVALTRKAKIQEGETVLVTAAAGATGLATVDLAANVFKCQVIAACGSDEKCETAKQKGAAHAINYNKENIRDRCKEITGGEGANIIVDMVGGKIWDQCVRSIAFEGRLVVIGFASGEIPKLPTNMLLVKSCTAVGLWWGNYGQRGHPAFMESVSSIGKFLTEGKLKPQTGATFPLAKINEAYQYVVDRKSTGKVTIDTSK